MSVIAYEISPEDEKRLLELFPPKYPTVRANHVTIKGGNVNSPLPPPARVHLIGYADDGNGVEALVVTVDGEEFREMDGCRYHITLSYDSNKLAPVEFDRESDPAKKKARPYGGVHSNSLIEQRGFTDISFPFAMDVVAKHYDGNKIIPGARFNEPGIK